MTATVDADGVVTTYYYDADDRLFAAERGGERYYVGTDAVGSPRLVVRASDGSVVRKVTYDAYRRRDGRHRRVRPADRLRRRPARRARPGFVRFGLRDYDPAAGRFTASDPTFFRGSAENLYNYAGNNPITQKDPSGLALRRLVDVRDVRRRLPVLPRQQARLGRRLVGLRRGRPRRRRRRSTSTSSAARRTPARAAFAEVTGKLGMVGGTVGGELDLGCMNAKAGAKVDVRLGHGRHRHRPAAISVGGGQNDLPMPGARLEGKIGLKGCKKFGFI